MLKGGSPRGVGPLRPALRTTLAAAAALLLASCAVSPIGDRGVRTVHTEGEGPLAASIGEGGNAIVAPAASNWTGTFGGFVLCTRDPGIRIQVQRVRYEASVEPALVVPTVRTTSPASLRPLKPAQRKAYVPVYAGLGSPPRFAEPYADSVLPGDYSTNVRGWQVDQSCEDTAALETQLSEGRVPSQPLKELLFVTTVGPRGGHIEQVDVDYLAAGRPMTLELHWEMVACGTAITEPDACTS